MTTTVWILIACGGAVVAFLVGWFVRGRRGPRITHSELARLRANARATKSLTADSDPPQGTRESDIIDLRDPRPVDKPQTAHNLQFVSGIGPKLDRALRQHDVCTLADLVALTDEDLTRLDAASAPISAKKIRKRFQPAAAEMLELTAAGQGAPATPTTPTRPSELRQVTGIGATMARWLETQGITTLAELAELTNPDRKSLQVKLTDYPGRIKREGWVKQARSLTEGLER